MPPAVRSPQPRRPAVRAGPGWEACGGTEPPELFLHGFLPWPSRVAVAGNLAPPARRGAAPPSRAADSANLVREQNLLQGVLLRSALRHGGARVPVWFSALDIPFSRRGNGRERITWRELFRRRRRGEEPATPEEARRDAWLAARLLNILRALDGPPAEKPDDTVETTPEASPTPSSRIGIAEGSWARATPSTSQLAALAEFAAGTFQATTIEETGDYLDMAGDIAAMGLGRVRRAKQSDAWYACLLPYDETSANLFLYGERVRPPAELRTRLLADPDSGAAFGRFGQLGVFLQALAALGLKADLGLFNGGGGHESNYDPMQDDDLTVPPSLNGVVSAAHTLEQIVAAKPAWQLGMLLPSGDGWDAFYHSEVAATHPVGAAEEPLYQQYAVNVWPIDGDTDDPGTSPFMKECARRKALALAAYAQSLGEYLAWLDASGALGVPLSEVVDTVEVGNELDSFWETDPSTGEAGRAAREVGRYIALLAGPIAAHVPGMRFRFELHSWGRVSSAPTQTNLRGKLRWFGRVVGEGLVQEVRRWNLVQGEQLRFQRLQLDRDGSFAGPPPFAWAPGVREWLDTCAAAGFQWPPRLVDLSAFATVVEQRQAAEAAWATLVPFEASRLLHEIGIHNYHAKDVNDRGITELANYADLNQQIRDIEAMRLAAAPYGFVLDATVGEIGISALAPSTGTAINTGYLAGANPKYQAAYLVQALAACLAAGARAASVFTFKFGAVSTTGWAKGYNLVSFGAFTAMGVRNDVQVGLAFRQRADQWPRPAWFAIRRLSWLLAQATGLAVEYAARGMTVVRFDFGGGLTSAPDGTALTRAWRHGYLMWIDPYAESTELHQPSDLGAAVLTAAFHDPFGHGYEAKSPVNLVPDVTPQTSPEEDPFRGVWRTDDNGYAEPSDRTSPNPDWGWAGWDAALGAVSTVHGAFLVPVAKGDFTTVIAPVFLLTDARFAGVA